MRLDMCIDMRTDVRIDMWYPLLRNLFVVRGGPFPDDRRCRRQLRLLRAGLVGSLYSYGLYSYGLCSYGDDNCRSSGPGLLAAYIVMAYIVMACRLMTGVDMAYVD